MTHLKIVSEQGTVLVNEPMEHPFAASTSTTDFGDTIYTHLGRRWSFAKDSRIVMVVDSNRPAVEQGARSDIFVAGSPVSAYFGEYTVVRNADETRQFIVFQRDNHDITIVAPLGAAVYFLSVGGAL